ncbi:class I histocompatibility antigen, F10 alpha chain isoform X2 [Carassius gibelio]|uniref:class I histocompatibility antigen, F10 alpha chain isoform X2 n=1 Tax=Carassius gibelio TaxID=101364 RepID=UPI002279109A|nr:class I histocompatibility antigen, F10 alpha chain isoform X2 [Carassius gibelio]
MRPILLLLLGAYLVCAGQHSHIVIYTATKGVPGFPEFVAATMVDGTQVNYYDSEIKEVIPRQDWVRGAVDEQFWQRNTQIRSNVHQVFKNNINTVMERFNQTQGTHIVQQMYGCSWDEETGDVDGFDDFGYDGESFLSLDLKNLRYISTMPEAHITLVKVNNNKALLEAKKQYRTQECIEWLKKYLQYGKSTIERKVSPQVSLLQKDPTSSVSCHATGFYPKEVTISWQKNKQDHDEDVDLGELIINEDGTFQKTSTLNVKPEEWKMNVYECVVEHKSRTIRSILTQDKIRTNYAPVPIGIIVGVIAAVLLLIVIGVAGYKVYQKKKGFKPVNASDDGSNNSAHSDPKA